MIVRFDKQLSSPEIINNYICNYKKLKEIDFVEDTPFELLGTKVPRFLFRQS